MTFEALAIRITVLPMESINLESIKKDLLAIRMTMRHHLVLNFRIVFEAISRPEISFLSATGTPCDESHLGCGRVA